MKFYMISALALLLTASAIPKSAEAMSTTVNCPGGSITGALNVGFDNIIVSGTCTENVEIRQDDVTIQGDGNDTVIGELFVNGARRVTIQNLKIQGDGTPGRNGIRAYDGAIVIIAHAVVDGAADNGVHLLRNSSAILDQTTIQNTNRGIVADDNSSFEVRNSSLVENTRGDLAIVVNRGCSGVVLDSTIQNNAGAGVIFGLGGGGNVYNSTIQKNGGSGVGLFSSSSAAIGNNTIADNLGNGVDVSGNSSAELTDNLIQNNGGSGVYFSEGASGVVVNSTVRNNRGGTGIIFDQGSSGTVSNSTVTNNGDVGVDVGYSSTASVDGNTIEAGTTGVGVGFGASAILANNAVGAAGGDDAASDMDWGATVRLAGNNVLTSSPNGFSIFLQQGSTLVQRSTLDTVKGPVWLRAASNAEFRKIHIVGNVTVDDHSLLRIRDLSGDPNVSVVGNISLSQDSGLNFIKNEGDKVVKVIGNLTCTDTESSISAPSSNVTISGKTKGCTGYNYVSN